MKFKYSTTSIIILIYVIFHLYSEIIFNDKFIITMKIQVLII